MRNLSSLRDFPGRGSWVRVPSGDVMRHSYNGYYFSLPKRASGFDYHMALSCICIAFFNAVLGIGALSAKQFFPLQPIPLVDT